MKPVFEAATAAFFLLAASVPGHAAAPAPKTVGPDVLFEQGQFDAAAAAYQAVPKSGPAYQAALRQLGAIALYRNHPEEAEARLRDALARNPADRHSSGLLAEALIREGKFAEIPPLLRQIGRPERAAEFGLFGKSQPYHIRGPAGTVTVEFEQTNPLPAIKATVNDLEGLFLIDTGASEIVLDPEFAREAQVQTTGARGAHPRGMTAAISFGRIQKFVLPGLETDDIPAMLLSTKGFSSLARRKHVAGVIGVGFLSHFRPTLDYVHDRLVLEPREAPARAPGIAQVPFWFVGDHFLLAQGRLDKGPNQYFFIDSGLSDAAFAAPESTLLDAGIAVPAPQPDSRPALGQPPAAKFPIATLSLGTLQQKNLTGLYGTFPPPFERGLGIHIGGMIGHPYFLPYAVTLDFLRMRIDFRK